MKMIKAKLMSLLHHFKVFQFRKTDQFLLVIISLLKLVCPDKWLQHHVICGCTECKLIFKFMCPYGIIV